MTKTLEMDQLCIPELAVLAGPRATEMLRVWIEKESIHCAFRVGATRNAPPVDEVLIWAAILADALRHVAIALSSQSGADCMGVADRIMGLLAHEIESSQTEIDAWPVHKH